MDNVSKKFDEWAINGKAESMEKGHGVNVLKFLKKTSFDKPFSFLDVGCGNGWVITVSYTHLTLPTILLV